MLYRDPEPVSATELVLRVRDEYEEVTADLEDDIPDRPRSIQYGDSRSLLEQMQGCLNGPARVQLALTLHAVSIVLLGLRTDEEV